MPKTQPLQVDPALLRREIVRLESEIEDGQVALEGTDRDDKESFPDWLTATRDLVALRARRIAMMETLVGTFQFVAEKPSSQGPTERRGPLTPPPLTDAEKAALVSTTGGDYTQSKK
jgi:hypothetical protein